MGFTLALILDLEYRHCQYFMAVIFLLSAHGRTNFTCIISAVDLPAMAIAF